jgi:hypothetical protein
MVKAIVDALVHAGLAIGVRLVFWLGIVSDAKYVSSDGGFVDEEGMKGGSLSTIKKSFELYKYLRNDPNLKLYRTTRLSPFRPFNWIRMRYPFNDSIRAAPIDLYAELRKKAVEEYLPRLPSPLTVDGVGPFFYNQYNRDEVSIYGVYLESVFGFTISHFPRAFYSGPVWEFPQRRYSKGINRDDPNWRRVRDIMYKNKQALIQYRDSHCDEIVKQFDRRYDGLFQIA